MYFAGIFTLSPNKFHSDEFDAFAESGVKLRLKIKLSTMEMIFEDYVVCF